MEYGPTVSIFSSHKLLWKHSVVMLCKFYEGELRHIIGRVRTDYIIPAFVLCVQYNHKLLLPDLTHRFWSLYTSRYQYQKYPLDMILNHFISLASFPEIQINILRSDLFPEFCKSFLFLHSSYMLSPSLVLTTLTVLV